MGGSKVRRTGRPARRASQQTTALAIATRGGTARAEFTVPDILVGKERRYAMRLEAFLFS